MRRLLRGRKAAPPVPSGQVPEGGSVHRGDVRFPPLHRERLLISMARFHVGEGLENPCADPMVQRARAEVTGREPLFPGLSKPLDLDRCLAIRKNAFQRRGGRDGRLESADSRGRRDAGRAGRS